jgi:hypothetical protein
MSNSYILKDNVKTYEVIGDLLAESSSRRPGNGSNRWVEFSLYRTADSLVYVVYRVGRSNLYHAESCPVVSRNHLTPIDPILLDQGHHVPHDSCNPSIMDYKGVFPENDRPNVQVCHDAEGVINHLPQWDGGNSYLTNVAKNLLIEASKKDRDIRDEFTKEVLF